MDVLRVTTFVRRNLKQFTFSPERLTTAARMSHACCRHSPPRRVALPRLSFCQTSAVTGGFSHPLKPDLRL